MLVTQGKLLVFTQPWRIIPAMNQMYTLSSFYIINENHLMDIDVKYYQGFHPL